MFRQCGLPNSRRIHRGAYSRAAGVDCFIKNLSLSGAFVESDCDLGLHTLIDVHVALGALSPRIAPL
jgi:hypothetical protein